MKIIGALIAGLILIGAGTYYFIQRPASQAVVPPPPPATEQATTTAAVKDDTKTVIGKTVGGRDVTAFHYGTLTGTTTKEVLFVGGTHGGYSWNTAMVAHELMDHLAANPSVIPAGMRVTVIPVLNPDGLAKVVGTADRFKKEDVPATASIREAGRFNGNNVDLNRNFDCKWQAEAKWQTKTVSGGTQAFSEPEAAALKAYVEAKKPDAAVVYFSAAGGVFASKCDGDILAGTRKIMSSYAKGSGYKANDNYNFYEVTGDMVNWLSKIGVPGISVLLTSHDSTEWDKNKKGIEAMLKDLAQ